MRFAFGVLLPRRACGSRASRSHQLEPPPPPHPTPPLSLCSTTAAFTVIRGTGDTRGLVGLVQPLAIVSLPTIGYAAYLRAAPPAALPLGVVSCALLHAFDRILKPRGLMQDNMPTTRLHRRSL